MIRSSRKNTCIIYAFLMVLCVAGCDGDEEPTRFSWVERTAMSFTDCDYLDSRYHDINDNPITARAYLSYTNAQGNLIYKQMGNREEVATRDITDGLADNSSIEVQLYLVSPQFNTFLQDAPNMQFALSLGTNYPDAAITESGEVASIALIGIAQKSAGDSDSYFFAVTDFRQQTELVGDRSLCRYWLDQLGR